MMLSRCFVVTICSLSFAAAETVTKRMRLEYRMPKFCNGPGFVIKTIGCRAMTSGAR